MSKTSHKNPKDILKEIKAEVTGVSPNSIEFKDLRARKKYKKKKKKSNESESISNRIYNQEGFCLTETGTDFCGYDEIGKKRKIIEKDSLEQWGAFDFFRFARKIYLNRYGSDWDLNIGGNSLEINRIRDKLYDLFGFCCNLIMRDYIIFFFDNYMDDFIRKQGNFFFAQMRNDWVISSFKDQYDFLERFSEYIKQEKPLNKNNEPTRAGMRESFLVGDTTLIANYGIVVALNWLVAIKKMNEKDAIRLITDACSDMEKKGMLDIIKDSTEFYSPYPSNLVFKEPQLIMDSFGDYQLINIEFTENDRMKFLQKRR